MSLLKMSPSEYAKHIKVIGCFGYNNKQSVQYRINNKMPLAGVVKRELVSGRWILTIDTQRLGRDRKNILKITA